MSPNQIGTLAQVEPETILNRVQNQIEPRLASLLDQLQTLSPELLDAMRYSVLAPGKRLRPALCVASAESVGESGDAVLDAAAALEMVHVFSLIHDDLPAIDDDDLRRGIPTCHKKFGEALAILAGDALFSLAFETLSHASAEPKTILKCIQILAKASGTDGLVGGEVSDVLHENRPVTEEALAWIHSRKTGRLIAASCEIGGLLGGASPTQVSALREFGELTGMAFQIADDLLNVTGNASQLGKAVGSDEAKMKATYPALYGVERSKLMAIEASEKAQNIAKELLPTPQSLQFLAHFAVHRLH